MKTQTRRAYTLTISALALTGLFLVAPHVAQAAGRNYVAVNHWIAAPPKPQEIAAIAADAKGNIYALQREPGKVAIYDAKGQFVRSWGEGAFPNGHAIRIDQHNNVWITDRDLHQVFKYTLDGKLLLTLGTKGVVGDNNSTTSFNRPSDVAVDRNGDILVSDGESTNSRVVKFSKDGKYLKAWGTKGDGPGQLNVPHSLAMDSKGNVYVASRSNQRIEIFTRDGGYVGQITNIGAPGALYITPDDVIYISDGTAGHEGVTLINARNRQVLGRVDGLNHVHLISGDRRGAIYAAELENGVTKFVRK